MYRFLCNRSLFSKCILIFLLDDIPIQLDKEDGEGGGLVAITEEKEEEEKTTLKSSFKANKESSSALAGVKNLPKTFSGLGKKVKESKVISKTPTQPTDKDKGDGIRKSIELEKEAVKYLKDDITSNKQQSMVEDLEFKRIAGADTEKVSLVSDSIKANSEDNSTGNGATIIDSYNENMTHNAIHVSSV